MREDLPWSLVSIVKSIWATVASIPSLQEKRKALKHFSFLLWKPSGVLRCLWPAFVSRGLGMPHMVSHRHASSLAFLCRALTEYSILEWGGRDAFPSLIITPLLSRTERHRKPRNQSRFPIVCRAACGDIARSSDLSQPKRLLYRLLVVGV